jgi:hypothetical protein
VRHRTTTTERDYHGELTHYSEGKTPGSSVPKMWDHRPDPTAPGVTSGPNPSSYGVSNVKKGEPGMKAQKPSSKSEEGQKKGSQLGEWRDPPPGRNPGHGCSMALKTRGGLHRD